MKEQMGKWIKGKGNGEENSFRPSPFPFKK